MRIDFHAIILTETGEKQKVLIELQKAIKRLAKAILEEKLRKDLEFEEEMEETFSNIMEELREKDRALEQKDRLIAELMQVVFGYLEK